MILVIQFYSKKDKWKAIYDNNGKFNAVLCKTLSFKQFFWRNLIRVDCPWQCLPIIIIKIVIIIQLNNNTIKISV